MKQCHRIQYVLDRNFFIATLLAAGSVYFSVTYHLGTTSVSVELKKVYQDNRTYDRMIIQ